MTTPSQARKSSDDGPRVYAWPPTRPHSLEVISVTSATKLGLPKPFLVGWAAKMAAQFAVDNHDAVAALVKAKQKRAAVELIKGASDRDRDNKADRGTIVHAAVEAYVAGKPFTQDDIAAQLKAARVDPALAPATYGMAQGALAFLQDTEPEIAWSEATVYSRSYEYAGTSDLGGRAYIRGVGRVPAVIDLKTSSSIHDEVALQLVAYARADFVGLDDGTEAPLFPDGSVPEYGIAVRPTADGTYETAEYELDDDVFRLFLSCLKTARLDGAQRSARRPS